MEIFNKLESSEFKLSTVPISLDQGLHVGLPVAGHDRFVKLAVDGEVELLLVNVAELVADRTQEEVLFRSIG
jgi:hypothetical protein